MGKLIATAFFGLILLFVGAGMYFTVDEGDRGIVLRNGAFVSVAGPGLNFKAPWIDDVVYLSTRSFVVKWGCNLTSNSCKVGPSENGMILPIMEGYSFDQQPADIVLTVNYRLVPTNIENVYKTYGSREALEDRVIARKIPQSFKAIFSKFTAPKAIQDRTALNNQVAEAIKLAVNDDMVVIDSVQIEDVAFSAAYEDSIEKRMLAEVEVQKRTQELETRKIDANITVVAAQAQADSNLAVATAEATAIRLKGEAEAAAIRARTEALQNNPALIELTKAEKWNGVLPTTVLPNGTIPFIDATQK